MIKKIAWILFRIGLINSIGFLIVCILCASDNALQNNKIHLGNFPAALLVITLFLSNTVYIVGNTLEALHSKLWNIKGGLVNTEKQFFKAALVLVGIVNSTAIVIYFVR